MRRLVALTALGCALVVAAPLAAGAAGRAAAPNPATDVCEAMVRNAVEASLGSPLPGPQVGAWAGRTYTCTYPLAAGQLVLRVDDLGTKGKAKAAYRRQAKAVRRRTRLNGLGSAAYQTGDGTLVALKDQFVLAVDPTAARVAVAPGDLAFAAALAVMGCWTGGS
jgi:hypothetical protein